MRSARTLVMAAVSAAVMLVGGCASDSDMAVLRQPPLPPLNVLKADDGREFFHNVFLQSVSGTPEFRWFDGDAILTTRPTRVQAIRMLNDKLARADMRAPDVLDADYLLDVSFNELRGPDVVPFSDKLASASITFRLTDRRRPGQVVLEKTVDASYRVRWSGFTPEGVRGFIAGPIGVTKDSAFAPLGGVAGGVILGYYLNDALVLQIAQVPLAGEFGKVQGEIIGGDAGAVSGGLSSAAVSLALSTARGHYSAVEAAFAGGLILGAGGGASAGLHAEVGEPGGEVAAMSGTERRFAATRGLIYVAFEDFMSGLIPSGAVAVKRAVSCDHLNPQGRRISYTTETQTEFALDCPGSRYNEGWSARLKPGGPPKG